jgi:hypothetical protein
MFVWYINRVFFLPFYDNNQSWWMISHSFLRFLKIICLPPGFCSKKLLSFSDINMVQEKKGNKALLKSIVGGCLQKRIAHSRGKSAQREGAAVDIDWVVEEVFAWVGIVERNCLQNHAILDAYPVLLLRPSGGERCGSPAFFDYQ